MSAIRSCANALVPLLPPPSTAHAGLAFGTSGHDPTVAAKLPLPADVIANAAAGGAGRAKRQRASGSAHEGSHEGGDVDEVAVQAAVAERVWGELLEFIKAHCQAARIRSSKHKRSSATPSPAHMQIWNVALAASDARWGGAPNKRGSSNGEATVLQGWATQRAADKKQFGQ